MEQLTWKNPNGEWGIKGGKIGYLDSAVCRALCKLKDYEDTGLSPDEVKQLNDFETQCADLLKKLTQEREAHCWIPVAERLPEPGQEVLTYIKHNYAEDGWRAYRVYEYTDHFVGMGNLCNVLAWMPLPEPYKEGT